MKCYVFKQFYFELSIKYVTTAPYCQQPPHVLGYTRNLRAAVFAYQGHHCVQ
jgi:hypothetical protein